MKPSERSLYMRGVMWAELEVQRYGINGAELNYETTRTDGYINDFDRGAMDYFRYYLKNSHLIGEGN